MVINGSWKQGLALLAFVGFSPLLQGQPSITLLQSGVSSATNGAAITAGTPAQAIKLFIGGNFAVTSNTEAVSWTENGITTPLTLLSHETAQLVANVPQSLFAAPGIASITVTEKPFNPPGAASTTSAPVTFTINPPMGVPASLPSGIVGFAYSQSFFTGGTGPFVLQFPSPPPGLTATTGTGNPLAGTPTQGGTFPVNPAITDSWGNVFTPNETVTIIPRLAITTASLPQGALQHSYSTNVAASGGVTPYTWSASGLPAGLGINAGSGVISGTPTISGSFSVTVFISDSGGQNTQATYPLQIASLLTISTTSLPAGTVQKTYGATVSATGGTTPYTWSATGLPAGLGINSGTGVISGTPTSSGAASVTVLLSDSGGQNTQATYPLQIASPLTISTTSLPAGTVQKIYSATVSATGGTTPYTWSATGLPAGVSINSGTGVISGTPASSGPASVTVFLSDSGGQNTQATYSLQIASLLTISTTSLSAGTVQKTYSATVSATGGTTPYTWSATGLPAGLSINSGTGVISGTPTSSGPASVTVLVSDSGGQNAQAPYSLQIASLLTISTTSLPAGTVQKTYSAAVSATGGTTPYTWSATGLPGGLSINSGTGVISGTPTSSGAASVTVLLSDSGGQNIQATYPLQIASLLTISTTSLPAGTVQKIYSTTVAASGGVTPYTWSASGLPAGLGINGGSGVISGTPTSSGTFSVTVFISDSGGQNTQTTYSLQINSLLTISTTSLPAVTVQKTYSATVLATGGTTPYTWSATGLPAGLNINSGTGVISGTPTNSGAAPVTVLVSDSGGQNTQATYSLQIASLLTISTTSLPAGRVQQSYSATVSATGGSTPYAWSATGLPAGLSINSGTGVISGTPTGSGAASVTVFLSDSGGQNAQAPYSLQIASLLTITTTSLPAGRVQQSYSATVSAAGGTTPYTWSATGLPAGLSINSGTGVISGTPTSSGVASVTVLLSDSGGQNTQATYPLQIASLLTISTTSLPAGTVQKTYGATVSATGGTTPYTWSATGLPAGLSINSGTGVISGTPTSSGVASVTVLLSDSGGQNIQTTYSLQIASLLTISTTSLPAGRVQQSFSATVLATGGTTPYTWSATGLPAGVSINSGTGAISGTPTNSGSFSATILLSDSGGQNTQAIYPLQIVSLFSITTSSLPAGRVQQPYSATVSATGGTTPYTWSATGLPTGLTIGTSTGVISGTPASSGTFSVTVLIADSSGQNAQTIYSLQIGSLFTITTSSLPAGMTQQLYSATVSASGGTTPYTWSATGLPSGLSINSNIGVISGTPASSGTFSVTVIAADSGGQNTQTIYSLQIGSLFTITTSSLPAGMTQQLYSATVGAGGGATPYKWSATGLPTGLSINSGSGIISGIPAGAGAFSVTVFVSDANGQTAQAAFSLQVTGGISIAATVLPSGIVGQGYSGSVFAIGGTGPYFWSATGLPAGLSLGSAGSSVATISGTPVTAGNFFATFLVSDSSGLSVQVSLPLQINNPALQITTTSLPGGVVGQVYGALIAASGGSGNYTFSMTGGSLPPNVQLAAGGQLSGTPGAAGTFTFTARVTDTLQNTSSRSLTITIAPAPVTISGKAPPTVTVNNPISVTVTATGGIGPYTYTISGNVPPGTTLTNGTLSGSPTTPGTYTFTITVTDSQTQPATSSQTFTIVVTPPPLVVTTSLPGGQVGQPYSAQLTATGGIGPYTWSGSGSAGLTVSSSGLVTGTPGAAGTFSIVVTITDSTGAKTTQTYSVTIAPSALTITTSSLPSGALTSVYLSGFNAAGGTPPYTWSVSGTPDGIAFSSAGIISGTPTVAGTFPLIATVKDSAGGTISKTVSLIIDPAPLQIITTAISQSTLGASFSTALGASGGTTPYTWTATGLPTGVTLAPNGTLSGTPAALGGFTATVTVTDANLQTVSQPLKLVIVLPVAPGFSLGGLPATATSGTQVTAAAAFDSPFPVDVTVKLTLTFAPASGADDPNIQFSNGGRTASETIAAGATTPLATIGVQTGTVAGVITITAQLLAADGTDITASPAPSRSISIGATSPTISNVTMTANATGLIVTLAGFDPTRSITQATFTFTPASGSTLQTNTFIVPAQSLFSAWFQSSASAPYGSEFSFTVPFTISGGASSIASVSVTLTNSTGTSSPVTATF